MREPEDYTDHWERYDRHPEWYEEQFPRGRTWEWDEPSPPPPPPTDIEGRFVAEFGYTAARHWGIAAAPNTLGEMADVMRKTFTSSRLTSQLFADSPFLNRLSGQHSDHLHIGTAGAVDFAVPAPWWGRNKRKLRAFFRR